MSTFDDEKLAVADMLDYLIHTKGFVSTDAKKEILEICPSDYRKIGYDKFCVMLNWMKEEGILKIEFHFEDDVEYGFAVEANHGYEIPVFKITVTSYGMTAIEKIISNERVRPKGLKFEEHSGKLFNDGKQIYKFTASTNPYKVFKALWLHSPLNTRCEYKKKTESLRELLTSVDLKRPEMKAVCRDMNKAFKRKRPPVPLRISINDDLISIEKY